MKHLFTLFLFGCTFFGAAAQGTIPASEIFQVGRAATSVFGGLKQAKDAQDRRRDTEAYRELITDADTLYNRGEYTSAIALYNQSLFMDSTQQYPKDRIAAANVELARLKKDPYQVFVDEGDSLYREMYYDAAIARFNDALALKREKYPQDRIAQATLELQRWKTVHFCGLPITDERVDGITSKAYSDDPYSDFLVPGKYKWLDSELTYANFQTLDGIAVPEGVRLIVYSKRDFTGNVLLDITGPAIVNNAKRTIPEVSAANRLQEAFPSAVRTVSASDMELWVKGSAVIIAPGDTEVPK
jgi:tetratricopeptide (TPR) repeat protein